METESSRTPGDRRSEMQSKPQTERKHPDQWEGDLNPDRMAGQNIGDTVEPRHRTAYDRKDVHRTLHSDFRDDELRAIPILEEGERLKQGAHYMDLHDPERREFTATGDMSSTREAWIVPKDDVPYSLWNRLRDTENPERIAERGDRDTREER